MDLRQLAALVAIADHGSFSGAAKALYTVQSNVSAHVAKLERELGVTLVDRASGRLTAEGALVAARARRITAELESVVADLASLGEEISGHVRIGVIGTTARWLVPQLLAAVRQRHPRVRVVVSEGSTVAMLAQLVDGGLDLAVLNWPVDHPDVTILPLFAEELMLLAPADHPLADREQMSLGELARYELMLPPVGTPLRDEIDEATRREGIVLRAAAEIDGVRLMASLAMEGVAPTIIPATAVPGWIQGPFRWVTVAGLPRRYVGLARRSRTHPSAPALALADLVVEVARTNGARQRGVEVVADLVGPPAAGPDIEPAAGQDIEPAAGQAGAR